MNKELKNFKRYCELLEKVYSLELTATKKEEKELDKLGYILKLNGVTDIISEINFNRLQKKLDEYEEINQ